MWINIMISVHKSCIISPATRMRILIPPFGGAENEREAYICNREDADSPRTSTCEMFFFPSLNYTRSHYTVQCKQFRKCIRSIPPQSDSVWNAGRYRFLGRRAIIKQTTKLIIDGGGEMKMKANQFERKTIIYKTICALISVSFPLLRRYSFLGPSSSQERPICRWITNSAKK